ncbi:MAG: RNA 2',3'-cyclic phosphodiesterase [Gemmatimonadetes bacterium]|nr:RNA 2',3'-cyclic phosphodiesterase [Gemmatimonadota bacterium]
MRLFVALNLPKKDRERIRRATGKLRQTNMPVGWTDEGHYHVTLKFLGEVRRERLEEVTKAMHGVAESTKSFTTKFSDFGAFPSVRQPRVIWLALGASPELRLLKQDLEWSFGDIGFEAETRAFHPHVTLGRAGDRDGAGAFRGLDEILAELECKGPIKVSTIDLMESKLSPQGSTYSVLSSARLAP